MERFLIELSPKHRCIWLLIDSLYSMFGDLAPFSELEWLLERYPQLRLYVDEAHTISWMGTHGRGAALEHLGGHERVTVAMSLNKAFSCAGGALALPSAELKTRIRWCGGPMLFSGPIQPPMLGAAVASSRLHLSAEHAGLQDEVMRRIVYARAAARVERLPLATSDHTPIFFVSCDSVGECIGAAHQLGELGFFVCPSAFPAVPVNRPGVRFTVGLHNELEDIDALIAAVRRVIPGLRQRLERRPPWGLMFGMKGLGKKLESGWKCFPQRLKPQLFEPIANGLKPVPFTGLDARTKAHAAG